MPSKRSRMTVAEFLRLYKQAVSAGVSREQFARQLGVKPDTIYQRVYDLNHKYKAGLPQLVCEGRKPLADQVAEALAEYRSGITATEAEDLEALLRG